MTVAPECYFPPQIIEYPDSDGKPMAEGDIQRDYMIYAIESLRSYFQNRPDAYISGNLFIYYEQGNPQSVVAPDTFVVFGVSNQERRSYKTWEEQNKTPDFAIEITSMSTRSNDQGAKKGIYAFLGVREYFQYDPTGDYLNPQIQGFRLVEGNYFPTEVNRLPDDTLSVSSEVLGLELRVQSRQMHFYNPMTQQKLLTPQEEYLARQQTEERAQRLAEKLRELNIDPDSL